MSGKFKEGDSVYFYFDPGDIRVGEISLVDRDGAYSLTRDGRWWDETDLFSSKEEAEATLSTDGQRLAGCFGEADRIHSKAVSKGRLDIAKRQTDVMQIAFKLFDAGGD